MRFYELSPTAKRVLYPLLVVAIFDFVGHWFHTGALGTSAFPFGGKSHDGKYVVMDHGREHKLTPTQFWLSYVHGASVAVVIVCYLGAFWYFRQTGDLKRGTPVR